MNVPRSQRDPREENYAPMNYKQHKKKVPLSVRGCGMREERGEIVAEIRNYKLLRNTSLF